MLKFPKRKPKRNSPERNLQATFFTWLFYAHRDVYKLSYSIPNGAWTKNIWEAIKLKNTGLRKGVWDVCISYPTARNPGLYIEFKIGSNKLTPEQEEWGERVRDRGYATAVCRTMDEAIKAITEYLREDVDKHNTISNRSDSKMSQASQSMVPQS